MKPLFQGICFRASAAWMFFLLLPVIATSQSLVLLHNGVPLQPNAWMVQPGHPDSSRMETRLDVTNVGTDTLEVLCRKTELFMLDSTRAFICWAGICYAPTLSVSTHSQAIGPGQFYTGFYGTYYKSTFNGFGTGESRIRWTFFNRADPGDSASATVVYATYPVGVNPAPALSGNRMTIAPNPAREETRVTIPGGIASHWTLVVQNLQGMTLMKTWVAERQTVQADLRGLLPGIYIVTAEMTNGQRLTGRLVRLP